MGWGVQSNKSNEELIFKKIFNNFLINKSKINFLRKIVINSPL